MRRYILPAFVILALVQIAVPAYTVVQQRLNLAHSEAFKFKIVPRDPDDPFRGKYLTLAFAEERGEAGQYSREKSIDVGVETGEDGYAHIVVPVRDKKKPWFTASNTYHWLQFPFNKYFINEADVTRAEKLLNDPLRRNKDVYALVYVGCGAATLKDLYVDGKPLRELLGK